MGGTLSQEQLGILSALQGVAQKHTAGIPKKELKQLLMWVRLNYPSSETRLLFEIGFWQEINRHLYLLATKKDETALRLLSPARIMLESISMQSKKLKKQQIFAGPSGAEGGERDSKQRSARAPDKKGKKALEEREQGIMSLPPLPPPRKPKKSLKPPETPESSEVSSSDPDTEAGEAAESGGGSEGGRKGEMEAPSRGERGDAAATKQSGAAAAVQAGDGTEEEEVMGGNFGTAFAGAEREATAAPAGIVPRTRAKGKAHGTSGESSQIASDTGSRRGGVIQLRSAPVRRRRGRAVVTSDPEVGTRRSARIAERARVPAGGRLRAPVGGADTFWSAG